MIWTISYWILLTLAITALAYALFWNRPGWRGRPKLRCKKCYYDLTATPGDLKSAPIQCPECGKKHQSKRSMRKTKRSKKWIAFALLLYICSYTAGVWPRVSQYNYSNGILGAVPTPVLILAIPLLPEESGTKVDRNTTATAIPYPQRPMYERIAHQLKIRLYKADDTSKLDHWLFMQVARRQTPAALMEKRSIRGDMYIYVFEAWQRQYRLTETDQHWASAVHELEINHTEYGLPQWFSYANVRVRKLLTSQDWRVQINKILYEPKMLGDWQTWDGFYDLKPIGITYNGRWDYNHRIYDELMTTSGFGFGTAPTTFDRAIQGRLYEGDRHADIWWPVAHINRTAQFKTAKLTMTGPDTPPPHNRLITAIEGFKIADDQQAFTDWIAKNIRVEFESENETERIFQQEPKAFPDFIKLWVDQDKLKSTRLSAFTFGGDIKVVLEVVPGGRYDGPQPARRIEVMEAESTWWALRDKLDKDGIRIFEGRGQRVPLNLPDQVWFMNLNKNDTVAKAYIEIRFGSNVLGEDGYRALADLDATQFITQTVQIPIRSNEYYQILKTLQSRSNMIDIGYKDLYEDGEIDALLEKHNTQGYSYKRRDADRHGLDFGESDK